MVRLEVPYGGYPYLTSILDLLLEVHQSRSSDLSAVPDNHEETRFSQRT